MPSSTQPRLTPEQEATYREAYAIRATKHAAIALLWQASDATEDGNGYPMSGEHAEHSEAVEPLIVEAVTAFVKDAWNIIQSAGVSAEQCGHDFIMTANRHGCGFWDRGLGEAGRTLTDATRGYSFDAEFALAGDRRITGDYNADDLVWLMVENTVIVNETLQAWGDNWEASDI